MARIGYILDMNNAVVRARVDSHLKSEAEEVFSKLGLTTTEAIRMFLSQVRLRGGLPFSVSVPSDNSDLLVSDTMRNAALDSVFDD